MINSVNNEWKKCLPLTKEMLSQVENDMQISIPKELRELFLSCNGGKPVNSYYTNDFIEVEIGSLIPISPPTTYKGESFENIYQHMLKSGLKTNLLPFAYDLGNAGIFCLDTISGEVIYWVHDEPEDPLKKVTESLPDLLSKLSLPPY